MCYDKPFKKYDEQITHLKSVHKLTIDNPALAERALRTFSYYDLINGYKDIFMSEDDTFKPGVTFEYLYVFNAFNINIQSIFFKYSVIAENIFKNNLAYLLSNKFGLHYTEYLNYEKYADHKSAKDRQIFFKTLKKIKEIADTTNDYPTKHYRDNHNHIPSWILFKNVNFGLTIDLAKSLRAADKNELNALILPYLTFNEDNKFPLLSALTIIRKYRNVIAHNLKFISFKPTTKLELDKLPKIFRKHLLDGHCKIVPNNTVYSFILSLVLVLSDPILINELIHDIEMQFLSDNNQGLILSDFCEITGIPVDIVKRLRNFMEEYQEGIT